MLHRLRRTAPLLLLLALIFCSGSPTEHTGSPRPGSETGLLVDSPVQGVDYLTSSGVSGTTSAGGTYSFNPNDMVTFRLGGLTLGSIPANGVLTPIDIANGSAIRLQNLLVLLQSLDQDGVPGNGLTISTAASAAITASLDLNMPPGVFASSNNTILVAAMSAAGITRPVVTMNQANQEFKTQLLSLLGFNTWILSAQDRGIVIRSNTNGAYLHAEVGPANAVGQAGIEWGSVEAAGFDVVGYWFSPSNIAFDSNGDWGLSAVDVTCERFAMYGDRLVSRNCQGQTNASLIRAPNQPTTIVGVWAEGSATALNVRHLVFLPNGQFMVLDPIGDTSPNPCGGPGVEYGTYTHTGNALRVTNLRYDTNGCAGLSNGSAMGASGLAFTVSGSTALVVEGGVSTTLLRVSK